MYIVDIHVCGNDTYTCTFYFRTVYNSSIIVHLITFVCLCVSVSVSVSVTVHVWDRVGYLRVVILETQYICGESQQLLY